MSGRVVETRVQDRNGVRVRVYVFADRRGKIGTSVEADCGCFGLPGRIHTSTACPALDSAVARFVDKKAETP